jgi:2-C-methyl-D-erythritol 2,4-cyclodiphosphate synthase
MTVRTGIGQNSHRFLPADSSKPCMIAGVIFEDNPGFNADSDGDIVFHALCNALTTLTGIPIFGGIADDLYAKDGITESRIYYEEALKLLGSQKITHIALAIEGKRPYLAPHIMAMRANIAAVSKLSIEQVGIAVTSGQGLSDFGCGEGMQCLALITTAG